MHQAAFENRVDVVTLFTMHLVAFAPAGLTTGGLSTPTVMIFGHDAHVVQQSRCYG